VDVVAAVRLRILDIDAVTALVASRVYVQILPQRPTLPAIRLQRISDIQGMHLRGAGGKSSARVQCDIVATTREAALAILAELDGPGDGSALIGWRGEVGSPGFEIDSIAPANITERFDAEDLTQFKVIRDYFVDYQAMH
jgi:hypothetical protein